MEDVSRHASGNAAGNIAAPVEIVNMRESSGRKGRYGRVPTREMAARKTRDGGGIWSSC